MSNAIESMAEVFVSSTVLDLVDERRTVIEAIRSLSHVPSHHERLSDAETPWKAVKAQIKRADHVLFIVGKVFGSTTIFSKSWVQQEYEFVRDQKLPHTIFMSEDAGPDDRQCRFRKDLRASAVIRTWTSLAQLKNLVSEALRDINHSWFRGSQKLHQENEGLRQRLQTVPDAQNTYEDLWAWGVNVQDRIREHEEKAKTVDVFGTLVLPGLLQSFSYARLILSAYGAPEPVSAANVRRARAHKLMRNGLRCRAIVARLGPCGRDLESHHDCLFDCALSADRFDEARHPRNR